MSSARKSSAAESAAEIVTIRIELQDTDPVIWREVEVPASITLDVLNRIIQSVMRWQDDHLWEFTIAKQRYGLPMPDDDIWGNPCIDAGKIELRDVLQPRKTHIRYLYDFGDSWEHKLTVTSIHHGDPQISYPRYIGGERNAPAEDIGGTFGFYQMLDDRADSDSPEHALAQELLGDYDPDIVDEPAIKKALARIAASSGAGRSRRSEKSRAKG